VKPLLIKVREVKALPGYRLVLGFSDGTGGVVSMAALLEKPQFRKLHEPKIFAQAFVESGAVEWPVGIGIASEALYAMAHGLKVPKTFEQAKANELEMSLVELRRLTGVTQTSAAAALEMDQGQVSRFERQEDRKISTLRRYVAALGAELEVVAVLGKKRVTLRGV
jgi:hypothetical protein